jgi:sialate O-acetylesterase
MTPFLHLSPPLFLISCRLPLFLLLLLSLPTSFATVTLPLLISDHLILPRAPHKAELWGRAAANAAVRITLDSQTSLTTVADSSGAWNLTLPPHPASHGPHTLLITDGGAAVTVSGVMFGDLLLCAGQSNMQMPVALVFNGSETLAATSRYPSLHLFSIADTLSDTPLDDVSSTFTPAGTGWLPASPSCGDDCREFSAVCFMTGTRLYDSLNGSVPIGLLAASWGSTPIAAWSSAVAVAQCGSVSPPNRAAQNAASVLWNAMIHPLRRLRLTAALWYQVKCPVCFTAQWSACIGGAALAAAPHARCRVAAVVRARATCSSPRDMPALSLR